MKVISKFNTTNPNMYLFYSIFDLDFFVRKNYTRQTFGDEFDAWEYAYGRVNDAMTGDVTTAEEVEMRKKMVVPLFGVTELKNSTISKKFNPLFSENEISEYFDSREGSNQSLSKDELISLYKTASDSKTANNVKVFFKGFKQTYGSSWPTTLSPTEIERSEHLSERGNRRQLLDKDMQILEKLKEFMLEDISSNPNPETPEPESQDN